MGVIKKRVDDYLYNSKGEEVEGAEKTTVSIPGIAFGGTRAKKHEFDLSAKGKKPHDKERDKLEEQTRQLWAPYLKNIGFDPEKHAPKEDTDSAADSNKSNAEPESTAPEGTNATNATNTSDDDLSEEDLEAATNPAGSGFGSNY